MKTIKGLSSKPSLLEEGKGINNSAPTLREMLRIAVGRSLAKGKEDGMERYQLGLKLMQDQDVIQLEDAEFKLLEKAVEENAPQFQVHYLGQLLLKLDEASKIKEPKEAK